MDASLSSYLYICLTNFDYLFTQAGLLHAVCALRNPTSKLVRATEELSSEILDLLRVTQLKNFKEQQLQMELPRHLRNLTNVITQLNDIPQMQLNKLGGRWQKVIKDVINLETLLKQGLMGYSEDFRGTVQKVAKLVVDKSSLVHDRATELTNAAQTARTVLYNNQEIHYGGYHILPLRHTPPKCAPSPISVAVAQTGDVPAVRQKAARKAVIHDSDDDE